MEKTPVILGLTRQAKLFGLPMPYTIVLALLTMLPFLWLDSFWWLPTGFVWYIAFRLFTIIRPNGAQLIVVMGQKTPRAFIRPDPTKGRRYV